MFCENTNILLEIVASKQEGMPEFLSDEQISLVKSLRHDLRKNATEL